MAAPKAKSLQQKLGFFDEDLKNPTHDEILKWVDLNIEKVINDVYNLHDWNSEVVKALENHTEKIVRKECGLYKNKKEKLLADIVTKYDPTSEKEQLAIVEKRLNILNSFNGLSNELPVRSKFKVSKKQWEFTVCNQTTNHRTGYQSSKNIIGFVDMRVEIECTKLTVNGIDFENEEVYDNIEWIQTEKDEYRQPLKYDIYIEVKTKIPSLGELFRQLNTYKEFVKGSFLVICPDDSEKEVIVSQGFNFYKYEK
ncbi:hypothetical protein [Fluviicola chungangensis]|uniref:Uncharacterized protein n=1 Tax=Fluviicola chungangensis TaxID=2597671 RepID=A0A556MYI5_9FLAO|nr:hypothetical protein [Fluviicola chungangensis]TSJ44981.1 hypothetical protein FO442_10315 [Fluviicola chungangensis]